jgi:tRNA pseudouridine65 synthase
LEPLQILYQDAVLIAVNKPAGIPVHRSRLVGRAEAYLVDLLREQVEGRLHPAHRLDAATSGVLLVARDRETAAALGEQFMAREPDKRYLAVVRGWPEPAEALIDYALPGSRPNSERRQARTRYRRLATTTVPIAISRYPEQRYALLEAFPETGRFRQIRKHLAHIHHPVIGDSQHGRSDHNRLFRQHLGCHRMLLHAERISFAHPRSGAPMQIRAPLDSAWQALLERFDWSSHVADAP